MKNIATALAALVLCTAQAAFAQPAGSEAAAPPSTPTSQPARAKSATQPSDHWGRPDHGLQAGLRLIDADGNFLTLELMLKNVGGSPLRVRGLDNPQGFRFGPPLTVTVGGKEMKYSVPPIPTGPAPFGPAVADVVLAPGGATTGRLTVELTRWGITSTSNANLVFHISAGNFDVELAWTGDASSAPLSLPLPYFKGSWSNPTTEGYQTRLVMEDWPRESRAPKVRLELRMGDGKAPDPEYLPAKGVIEITANEHDGLPILGRWVVDLKFEKKPGEDGVYRLCSLDLSEVLDRALDLRVKEIATFHNDYLYTIRFEAEAKTGVASGGSLPSCYVCLPRAVRHTPKYHLGLGHLMQGQYKEAVAAFDEAIKAQPEFAPAYGDRARAYYALKKYSEALADVSMCRKMGGRPDPALVDALAKYDGATTAPARE